MASSRTTATRRSGLAVVLFVMAAAALAACGAHVSRTMPTEGLVVGSLQVSPPMGPNHAVDGRVVASGDQELAGAIAVRGVGSSGTFALRLMPGTWTLYGFTTTYGGGRYRCTGGTVTILAGRTSRQSVTCIEK